MPAFDPPRMEDERRRRRQAFLAIGEQDRDNVRALRAGFARHARAFAEQFYQHLLAHPETAALLRDPEQLERF